MHTCVYIHVHYCQIYLYKAMRIKVLPIVCITRVFVPRAPIGWADRGRTQTNPRSIVQVSYVSLICMKM